MSPRIGFFVDGFNLYHSVAKVAQETADESVKWLDLQGLARGIQPLISPAASLASIHYFTALRLLIAPIAGLSASACPVGSFPIVRLNGGERLLCRDAVPTLPSDTRAARGAAPTSRQLDGGDSIRSLGG
jgi:hypothetical protein